MRDGVWRTSRSALSLNIWFLTWLFTKLHGRFEGLQRPSTSAVKTQISRTSAQQLSFLPKFVSRGTFSESSTITLTSPQTIVHKPQQLALELRCFVKRNKQIIRSTLWTPIPVRFTFGRYFKLQVRSQLSLLIVSITKCLNLIGS